MGRIWSSQVLVYGVLVLRLEFKPLSILNKLIAHPLLIVCRGILWPHVRWVKLVCMLHLLALRVPRIPSPLEYPRATRKRLSISISDIR